MEPNLLHELPEVELSELVLRLQKEKKFKQILQIFLNLLRIRLHSYLQSIQHNTPNDMNTSDLLSVFSSLLKNEIGISILATKVDQLITIEEYLLNTKKPTQKQLKLYICYTMDLYYQLEDFDPNYLIVDYRKRIAKMLKKQEAITISKSLRFMQPLVRYVTEFKKSNSLRRKLNPFRSSTVSIPKSVSPILKEYVESKFNEEVLSVQEENQKLTDVIKKTLELEETKKSLTDAFDVVSPVFSEAELSKRKTMVTYLFSTAIFVLVFGVIFLLQIILYPQAWQVFLMFGVIPIAVLVLCMYLASNIWRVVA